MGATKAASRYGLQGNGMTTGCSVKMPSSSCQMRVKTRIRISTSPTTTRKLLKT